MKNHLMIATTAIAFAANSFAADWRSIAEAAGPSWKATATGLEAKGPRYYDLPQAAPDGMGDDPYAYFQSRAVNLWQYAFLGDAGRKDYTLTATVRVLEPAPIKGFRPGQGNIFMNYQWGREAIGSDVGLIVRHTDADNYYQVRISTAYGHVELWKTHGGVVRVKPFAFEAGKDYRVAVTASGPWIIVSVDGQELIRYADPVEPLLTGNPGLAVRESAVSFSDVTVTDAPAITEVVPAHKPDFHIRKWVGRDYIFDGDEPVGHITADRSVFEEFKLRPGLMPMLIAQTTPVLWGPGLDNVKWSDKGKMEVLAEGNELQLTLGLVELNGILQSTGQWRLTYDAKQKSYVLDGKLSADVLKEGILSKWGSFNLTDPMFYQLLASSTDAMPACRSHDNAAIFLRADGVLCSFPLNHAGKNNAFAPAHELAIKPDGYWVTVVDGWGVATEIPADNAIRYYGDYCHWGLDQHIAQLWKPDQESYIEASPKDFPTKAGDRFEGHVRYRLWDRQEVSAAIAKGVRPTTTGNPDRPLMAHVEPVNNCATILPLVNGTSRSMWQGDYEIVRDTGRNDNTCMRLNGGKSAQLNNVGPSYRAGPYLAKTYKVGAWVRSRDFHGTIRCSIDSAAYPKPNTDPKPSAEVKFDGPGDWVWLGFETSIPHQSYFFNWSFQATGTGSVDIDDITLEPVSPDKK
jgi:hypothetical protein